jgi:outer membrane protein assembly factor BamB
MTAAAPAVSSAVPPLAAYASSTVKPRLWPALILVAAYWILWAVMTVFYPATFIQFMTLFYSPMVLGLGIVIWWLFFSRLPVFARLWALTCLFVGAAISYSLAHKSMNWMGLLMYALPLALTFEVLWLLVTGGAANLVGWLGIAAISFLTWGYFDLLRVDGITAGLVAERSFRWTPTAEDKYLAEQKKLSDKAPAKVKSDDASGAAVSVSPLVASAGDWPEFRGPHRDGVVRGVRIEPDWKAHPPRDVWRRRVGPAWSSFAVIGDHVFTQEQRGESEAVLCFDLATGNEIWSFEDKTRFWEVVAGAGPRATPTFHEGKLYALGGSGKLNCLDAATGKLIWSRDVAAQAGTKAEQWGWGFSSSPLVAQGVVTVFAINAEYPSKDKEKEKAAAAKDEGKKKSGLFAYDALTGEPRWTAGQGAHSYSSPHLFKSGDGEQVLMISDRGLEAFHPVTGKLLWEHEWVEQGMFRVVQPQLIGDSQFLVGTGMGFGTRQVTVAKEGETWKVTPGWSSKELKPYFNDAMLYDGHLYGFDGDILICFDPATGKKKWKKGRYGHGQALLVADQGLIIVISDKGEAILVEANPKELVERGRFQALNGKTWNHPVLTSSSRLLFRNSEEMACYDVAPSK